MASLTWAPPALTNPTTLTITTPGTYNLYAHVDYRISAPNTIQGAVHLRGGRNIVWVGGHIRIPWQSAVKPSTSSRRAIVISDCDATRGNPTTYGYTQAGRVVHIEGLLIDGGDLTEGINTNCPKTLVRLQNIRVEDPLWFRGCDDRDGTNGWSGNHSDIIQTWGSHGGLHVDGLTGSSTYQGVFLKEDVADRSLAPVRLRRVNLTAVAGLMADGCSYSGHRMLSWYEGRTGNIYLETGTVRVTHSPTSGWVRANLNPAPDTDYWRHRYWSVAQGAYVTETPPGGSTFRDALGDIAPTGGGTDIYGTYAHWKNSIVLNWLGAGAGRVYSGPPPGGDYVPAGLAGLNYTSPGYL